MPKFGIKYLLIFVTGFSALAWMFASFVVHQPDPALLALPANATNIKQFSALPPIYQLKAKVTKSEFDEFVQRSRLRPTPSSKLKLGWVRHQNKSWWDPVPGKPPSHYSQDHNNQNEIAKYENGHLYFQRY